MEPITLAGIANRSESDLDEDRDLVRNGDPGPIRDMLYDAALTIHSTAIASVLMVPYSPTRIEMAMRAVNALLKIHETIAKDNLSDLRKIPETLFHERCLKIMNYIARKGGAVYRFELLASRVLAGTGKEYDQCVNALIDAGHISQRSAGKRKDTVYSLAMGDQPQLVVEIVKQEQGGSNDGQI